MIQFVIALAFLLAFPALLNSSEPPANKSKGLVSNERQQPGNKIRLNLKIDLLRTKRRKIVVYLAGSSLEVVDLDKPITEYNNTHQPASN